jgi:hypothetical protein
VSERGHLRAIAASTGFRRLLGSRLAGQFGDGLFQASLAGAVLFNPERQAHAADVAAGFTVLLLPYSVIGPFAGVLLDRWLRQRVLVVANAVRAGAVLGIAGEVAADVTGVPFYASALVLISISRFVLSALSAAQPHVVADAELVTANAVAATVGTIVTAAGGGVAIGIRALIGTGDGGYAVIAAAAALPFFTAAGIAGGFDRAALGPSEAERRARETLAEVARGLAAGARHVRGIPEVATALAAIGVHRLCFGVWTVCTVLLYRNYFHDDGPFRAGLGGLAQVVALVALGAALAAVTTPTAFRHYGGVRWPAAMLAASALIEATVGLVYSTAAVLITGLLLGFASQAVKISVDTLIQHHVVDAFRGRVFALYDMLFNIALVLAAVLTAAVLPEDGHSPAAVIVLAFGWALTAAGYLSGSRRTTAAAH